MNKYYEYNPRRPLDMAYCCALLLPVGDATWESLQWAIGNQMDMITEPIRDEEASDE